MKCIIAVAKSLLASQDFVHYKVNCIDFEALLGLLCICKEHSNFRTKCLALL